ncbi:MAG: hypothetical protein QM831_25480 [Kofleriaceae bacterium]
MRVVSALLVMTSVALASPGADLVVTWTPGVSPQPIVAVGRTRGVAVIDRSPASAATPETARWIAEGKAAYDAIKLPEAQAALDEAKKQAETSGAAGLSRAQLSDLFLYRGLVAVAQGNETAAWDELVEALLIYPSRTLDPSQYAPKVSALLERVQKDVADKHPNSRLAVQAPAGCTTMIDGEPVAGAVLRPTGPHFVRVTCPDSEPWTTRIDLPPTDTPIPVTPRRYTAPSDTDVLVQARAVSAKAVITVELHDQIATIRLIAADGRERDRRTATIARGDLSPVARIVDDMLAPVTVARPWYQSKWTWIAGAVIVTAAIVIPITAAIASDTGATNATARPTGPGFQF